MNSFYKEILYHHHEWRVRITCHEEEIHKNKYNGNKTKLKCLQINSELSNQFIPMYI